MAITFQDRESARPGRYKVTTENGTSYYVNLERADEPIVIGTPLNAAVLNSLFSKDGGAVGGQIIFENADAYHVLTKHRSINGQAYSVNMGCGVLGGKGVVCFEARAGSETTSPRLGRLEIGELGVSYVDPDGKRTYLFNSGVKSTTVG